MLNFLHHLFHHRQKLTPSQQVRPDNLQNQAIDVSDSVWQTYDLAYLDHFKHKQFVHAKPKQLAKAYPAAKKFDFQPDPVYKWINELANDWTVLSVPTNNIYKVQSVLETSHSDNFYALTMHENLYRYLRDFLLRIQPKAFIYPACYVDKDHGRIILPGDEQHFLLPERDIFNTTKYDNNVEWDKFITYIKKRKGIYHPKKKQHNPYLDPSDPRFY